MPLTIPVIVNHIPQGRLTLTTAVPVLISTVSAATTVYYTPYNGNLVPLYNGTNIVPRPFTELSVATTDTTKSPAAIGASKVNDWFVWDDSGTLRIGHGPDWTNDTTRSAGTALVRVNGLLLNNAALTNGPAASRGTYVGTTRSNASSQIDYIFGAAAASGTAGFFGVWNMYNRVDLTSTVSDTTATWAYSSATVRSVNASATNRISFVSGLAEDGIFVSANARGNPALVAGTVFGFTGFALDATNAIDAAAAYVSVATSTASSSIPMSPAHTYVPQLGFHFFQATEQGDGTNNTTWNGGSAPPQQRLSLRWRN